MQFRCSRRYFLKLAAGATAGAAAAQLGHVLQNNRPLRIGLVGLGDRGLRHLEFAARTSAFRVTDICDTAENALFNVTDMVGASVRKWTDYGSLLNCGSHEVLVLCVPHDQQTALVKHASLKGVPIYLDPGTPHEMPSDQEVSSPGMVSLHLTNRISSTSQQAVAHSKKGNGSILITCRQNGRSPLPSFDAVDLLTQMLPSVPEWTRLRVFRLNQPWGNDYELYVDREVGTTRAYLKTTGSESGPVGTAVHFYSTRRQFHAASTARGASEADKLHGDLWGRFSAAVRAKDARMFPISLASVGLSTIIVSAIYQASIHEKTEWIIS
jgi:hypothetical protein